MSAFSRENLPSRFKFKEYCPMVFRNLRERFGIDDQDYQVWRYLGTAGGSRDGRSGNHKIGRGQSVSCPWATASPCPTSSLVPADQDWQALGASEDVPALGRVRKGNGRELCVRISG